MEYESKQVQRDINSQLQKDYTYKPTPIPCDPIKKDIDDLKKKQPNELYQIQKEPHKNHGKLNLSAGLDDDLNILVRGSVSYSKNHSSYLYFKKLF